MCFFAYHKTLNISLQLQLIKVALSPACTCDSAFNYPDPAFICTVVKKLPAFNRDPAFNGDPAIIGSFTVFTIFTFSA